MNVVRYEPERAWVALQNPATELANAIAGTDFVPRGLRGNPAAITAAILFGDEVGLGPMQSLAKVAVIDGRPALAAEAQRALILRAGHELWTDELTNSRCTMAGRRRDSEQVSRVTWTLDDAKRARLDGKPSWRLYPRQMLAARATAELARLIFADVIGGLAIIEELDDEGARDGAPPPPDDAPTPTRRRRRAQVTAKAETVVPEAAPPPVDDLPLPDEPTPEPMPEPPEPEPEPELEPAATIEGPNQEDPELEPLPENTRRRMMASFRARGFESSDERHRFASFILGREIQSSVEISPDEAGILIETLEGTRPPIPRGEHPEE